MKAYITSLLLLSMTLAVGCKKEAPELELPPATQEGLNVGGCRVDDKVFVTSGVTGTVISNSTGVVALVFKKAGESTYRISIGLMGAAPNWYVNLECQRFADYGSYPLDKAVPTQYSPLPEPDYGLYRGTNANGAQGEFITGPTAIGRLIITHFDLKRQVIAGVFSFVGQDSLNQQKATITSGRFDAQFSYIELP